MTKPSQDIRRWKEGFGVIHADGEGGNDATLCGYAYEGACLGDEDSALEEVGRGKINCEACVRIILYAKSIPARLIAKDIAR